MTDERIRGLERSVANAPADATTRLALARELARAGRRDESRGHVSAILRADPLSVDAVRTLDDLGFAPLAHDAPWPTPDGQNDRARRSAHPGARRGELVKRIRIGRDGETASSMTVGAATVYVASSSQRLIALDIETGSPRWIRDFQSLLGAPVIGEGERLLIVADSTLQLLDSSGQTLWSTRIRAEQASCTLAPRGLALVTNGDVLQAHDAVTGAVRWSFKGAGRISDPLVDADTIFTVGTSICALGLDGKTLSRLRLPRGSAGSMVLLRHALYLKSFKTDAYSQPMAFVVKREGARLGAKTPITTGLTWFGCAIDDERFFVCGLEASIQSSDGTSESLGRHVRATVSDSGSCIFAMEGQRIVWLDGTGALVKSLMPIGGDFGSRLDMAIGPNSTLLVPSPRGILHVIA